MKYCENEKKVAVLAIDPSSTKSGGSILGDKTRMELLSRHPNSFIRPSPTGGILGGVARKTRETILLCEAAGYDIIIVETVGVGQSETHVRSMTDIFLLVLLPGAGDELQGIKKGIIEISDGLIINKSDGDNKETAKITLRDYKNALHLLPPSTEGWETGVILSSALNDDGIDKIRQYIADYIYFTKSNGVFEKRRKEQELDWMDYLLREELLLKFFSDKAVTERLDEYREMIRKNRINVTSAVNGMLELFMSIR